MVSGAFWDELEPLMRAWAVFVLSCSGSSAGSTFWGDSGAEPVGNQWGTSGEQVGSQRGTSGEHVGGISGEIVTYTAIKLRLHNR